MSNVRLPVMIAPHANTSSANSGCERVA
jgi:hypothetical protein